jgi:hypothetical protein
MSGKKKKSRKGPSGMKKIMRGIAYGVADAMIITPALIPVVITAKELAAGHTVAYSVNSASQAVAGISLDGGDLKPDFGKVTAYAIGSGAMVLLGMGFRKFIGKRV